MTKDNFTFLNLFTRYWLFLMLAYVIGSVVFFILDGTGIYIADGSSMFHGFIWIGMPIFAAIFNLASAGLWAYLNLKMKKVPLLLNLILLPIPGLILVQSSGFIVPFVLISLLAVVITNAYQKSLNL